jgi:hypothetical protein
MVDATPRIRGEPAENARRSTHRRMTMASKEDVAKDKGSRIRSPDDSRVGWDSDTGQYYLKGDDGEALLVGGGRIILVFVGASLGPVHRKGVLQTRIDPAAVRVGVGERLRWIIEDLHDQSDTTEIQITRDDPTAFWPFEGASPDQDPEQFKSLRDDKNGKNNEFAETVGGRLSALPPGGASRTKYNIKITFKEDRKNGNSPELVALIDPDVVYNPPGF